MFRARVADRKLGRAPTVIQARSNAILWIGSLHKLSELMALFSLFRGTSRRGWYRQNGHSLEVSGGLRCTRRATVGHSKSPMYCWHRATL